MGVFSIKKSSLGSGGTWYGITNDVKNATLEARVLVFGEKSTYGINGGRISKLYVTDAAQSGWGKYLYEYDRALLIKSNKKEVIDFVNEIIRKYN